MRVLVAVAMTLAAISAPAATLEKLTLDSMIDQATEVVRGRVLNCQAAFRGPMIYTNCDVVVVERLKGANRTTRVSIPGGVAQGKRQVYSGAPRLAENDEYVLFLWTGRTGVTQVIGFSQGVLVLSRGANGALMASRDATNETLVDSTGQPTSDAPIRMTYGNLKARIAQRLGGAQ
jgi:hypothetical protein